MFWSGLGAYKQFRIPVLLRTVGQELLAFAEGRPHLRDNGNIDITMRRSSDGGRSWSSVEALLDGSALGMEEILHHRRGGVTVGNPVPVFIRERRELLLLFNSNFGSSDERRIRYGLKAPMCKSCPPRLDPSGPGGRRTWISRSFTMGRNWSRPIEITANVKLHGWTWYAVGPGGAIRTRNGSLIIPATHASQSRFREIHGKYDHSHVLISDDLGTTWRIGGIAATGTNEATVAELPDARLLLNARYAVPDATRDDATCLLADWATLHLLGRNLVKSPGGERMLQLSTDGGASWGAPWTHPGLRGPRNPWFMPAGCHGSMISVRRGRELLFAGPDTRGEERLNVSLIGSVDGGRSWSLLAQIHQGPSAYASLARLLATDGGRPHIGVLYEGGGNGEHYAKQIHFVRWAV